MWWGLTNTVVRRLYLCKKVRAWCCFWGNPLNICKKLLQMLYDATFLNRVVSRAESVVGFELDFLELILEKRTLNKFSVYHVHHSNFWMSSRRVYSLADLYHKAALLTDSENFLVPWPYSVSTPLYGAWGCDWKSWLWSSLSYYLILVIYEESWNETTHVHNSAQMNDVCTILHNSACS